jgi:hypothetical protein
MRIVRTEADIMAVEDFKSKQRTELLRGKLTVRWLQSTASYHIFSGNRRPSGIEGFIHEDEAAEWLNETHGITL